MAVRKLTYSFILLALIAVKVCSATIHISLHHDYDYNEDHKDDCELCEQALSIVNEEFSPWAPIPIAANTTIAIFSRVPINFQIAKVSYFSASLFFTRPPPIS